MRLSVNSILSVFRLIVWMLEKREAEAAKRHDAANAQISELIAKREAYHDERGRAAAAQRKLRELVE
jgi:RNase H-fold protein (predicted Holliday junction resolvase)